MKNLILIAMTILVTACGKSGSGSNGVAHVVDSTPHSYVADVYNLEDSATHTRPVEIHEVCDFGLPTLVDVTSNLNIINPGGGGISCGELASNYTVDITNTGDGNLYLFVTIDGTRLTDAELGYVNAILPAGETFHYQRGF